MCALVTGVQTCALPIFSAEEDARSLLTAAKTHYSGTLNLHAIGPYDITAIIKAYRSDYPGVQVTVTVGDSQSITQRILDYQGDIGLVLNEITDQVGRASCRERVCQYV